MPFRTLLFVPGTRKDRFDKAVMAKPDSVCIDLEDSVPMDLKDEARSAAMQYLQTCKFNLPIGIRINDIYSLDGLLDLVELATRGVHPSFVMLPKTKGPHEVTQVRSVLGEHCCPIWAIIESPDGVSNASNIASSLRQDGGIMFGGADYAASIGSDMTWEALYHARGVLINAAGANGCATLDMPYLDVRAEAHLRDETERSKAMGFTGRACIHPIQIKPISEIFTPSEQDLSKAEKVVAAYENAAGGAALLDGKLIDKPIWLSAKRILEYNRN